jgi:hypothetical protein
MRIRRRDRTIAPYQSVSGPLIRVAENCANALIDPVQATVKGECLERKV